MAEYNHCPNCGNTDEGDDILRCTGCNLIHCDDCGPRSCPDCGPGHDRDTLGTIEADDSDPDEDAEFKECPNCGNTEEGTSILECKVCGLKHCDDCSEKGAFLPTAGCPTPDCAGASERR